MEELRTAEQLLDDIEAINSLDTARMSLRWALERINLLQKTSVELEEKLSREQSLRRAEEEKSQALARKDALRESEQHQRQRYYARLDELLAASRSDAEEIRRQKAQALALKESLESEQKRSRELAFQARQAKDAEDQNLALRAELKEAREDADRRERLAAEETAGLLAREADLRLSLDGRISEVEAREAELEAREREFTALVQQVEASLESEN